MKQRIGVYICHCGGNISDYVDVEELEADAYFGLLKAAENFDPTRNVKFRTFAAKRIHGGPDFLPNLRGALARPFHRAVEGGAPRPEVLKLRLRAAQLPKTLESSSTATFSQPPE